MTEVDIRKLHGISKKYVILYKVFAAIYPAHIYEDTMSVSGLTINLADANVNNFSVCVPLSQIKKGLQPQ